MQRRRRPLALAIRPDKLLDIVADPPSALLALLNYSLVLSLLLRIIILVPPWVAGGRSTHSSKRGGVIDRQQRP